MATTKPLKEMNNKGRAVKLGDKNTVYIDENRMREAFGSTDERFILELAEQVIQIDVTNSGINQRKADFICSVIEGVGPRDQIEAMLAAQMAAVHMASMSFSKRLRNVETVSQLDSYERGMNKLMRTFTNQMEGLRKYRNGGEQKVTVQHVTVNDGGQAVVGNIGNKPTKGGGGDRKN